MKNKFLSIVLVLSTLLSFMPIIAAAQTSGTCGADLTWVLDDNGTLTISGTGDMHDYDGLGERSPFRDNTNIKKLIVENGVTSIGYRAFYDCTNLTSVILPEGLTSINDAAFFGCENITNIKFPEGLISIGSSAFQSCTGLTSVTFPSSLKTLEGGAFSRCTNLDKLYITDMEAYLKMDVANYDGTNPIYYANKLYLNNKRVTSVEVPEGITSIPAQAFYGCDSLTNITIPNTVETIGTEAFYNCKGLTNVVLPEGLRLLRTMPLH